MDRRPFGRTDLGASALGFGTWPMSGEERYGAIEDAEAVRAIRRALDSGMNCVAPADVARIEAIVADAAGTIRAFTPLRPAMERWESRGLGATRAATRTRRATPGS